MNKDDEDIDEDEDDEEVENLNTAAIKCFTLMNVFLAKKRPGYPGREVILSHAHLLALTKFIGEIARTTVIHVVVAEKNLETDLIQYILQLGTDPKVKDDDGQTPFYVMAGRRVAYRDGNSPIFRALVHAAGSHLDTAKMNGDTVLNLKRNLAGFRGSADGVDVEVDAYFSSLLNAVLPLTCCCARVIRRRSDSSYSQPFVSRRSDNGK
ncbi:hypothetical protein DAPPUDRAFT_114174 [Daphnia pulex]|uniref:Uncharacterized protein n=1 Tax=Daphnia pulex TaxID=6669 RepID=E9HH96_DAPPU|nr:hypothetical protein DAPPUDRAFT_114174 [Daphnia pulex]|eukprot:EFX68904.1 hypothetical protein DAPPUDRAFT_114174 [Daphnia pulex]